MLASFDSEAYLRFRPPTGFSDSRELSEAECDRERALDLEVQSVLAGGGGGVSVVSVGAGDGGKATKDEMSALLAR